MGNVSLRELKGYRRTLTHHSSNGIRTEVGVLSQPGPLEPYGADCESGSFTPISREADQLEFSGEYVQLTRNAAPFFKPHGENVYEICFPVSALATVQHPSLRSESSCSAHPPTSLPSLITTSTTSPSAATIPATSWSCTRLERVSSRSCEDQSTSHRDLSYLFRTSGRTDDQIMLSSGEKTNAGPLGKATHSGASSRRRLTPPRRVHHSRLSSRQRRHLFRSREIPEWSPGRTCKGSRRRSRKRCPGRSLSQLHLDVRRPSEYDRAVTLEDLQSEFIPFET